MRRLCAIAYAALLICATLLSVAASPARSPAWRSVRAAFLRDNPVCAACEARATVAHHVIPFHVRPDLELCDTNLIAFCGRHHLIFGHLESWRSWNTRAAEDAALWKERLARRPFAAKKEDAREPAHRR